MINLFFSYSHQDEALRNELDKHLTILKRNGIINTWHDRCILPGAEFDKEISLNLKKADIILILISPDFLASDYCYDNEMKFAMRKHEKNEAIIIPVILRPCDWKDTEFGKLLATPTDGNPVIKFPTLDDAFLEITNQIKKSIAVINKKDNRPEIPMPDPSVEKKLQVRSSNLRIKKIFSDQDKDKFLEDSFEYIAKYFEGSLEELKNRNPEIEFRYKRIDSQTFTAQVYVSGHVKSECMVYYGAGSFSPMSINYTRNISNSKNTYNESLQANDDGYTIFLNPSPMGKIFNSWGRNKENDKLTNEGAAEFLWEILIEHLQ